MLSAFMLFTPLILHFGISVIVNSLLSRYLDLAGLTSVTALITIPVAAVIWLREKKKLGEKKENKVSAVVLCGCIVLGALMNVLFSRLLELVQATTVFSNAVQERLFASDILIQVIGLGLLVPVAEELIFRGLIFNRMKRMLSANYAIVFSALLFALYHGNPIQMLFAVPMALILAWVYEKSGSFLCPVCFHIGSNLLAVLLNLFA